MLRPAPPYLVKTAPATELSRRFRTAGPLPKVEISVTASRWRFTLAFRDELCREVISTSRPVKDVATAYGVSRETLGNWLIKYREANGGTETDLTTTDRARLKELEREAQELRAETAFKFTTNPRAGPGRRLS